MDHMMDDEDDDSELQNLSNAPGSQEIDLNNID